MKERLVYLDAAKGIGMLLIVCAHLSVSVPIPMLASVKVALFFLLSGLFVTAKDNVFHWLGKNVRSLMVPFLTFYVLSYMLFYIGKAYVPGFNEMTGAKGLLDCFTQKQYFNGPIWFLLSLFWMKLFVYTIQKITDKGWLQLLLAMALGTCGFMLNKYEADLPLAIDTALTYTPVMLAGNILWKSNVIQKYTRAENAVFSGVLYLSSMPVAIRVADSLNRYGGGVFHPVVL